MPPRVSPSSSSLVRHRRPGPRLALALGGAVGGAVVVAALRRRQLRWGASDAEIAAALPGDELVPDADLVATRAISIEADCEDVMPWLRQLGWGRGGFYTYTRLENLAGLGLRNASTIQPQWQVAEGDDVHLAEGAPLRVAVASDDAVVLHGVDRPDQAAMPFAFSWAFVVVPAEGGCRLLVRERYGYRSRAVGLLVEPVSWISWLFTHGMLRGVRERAEAQRHRRP